MEHRVKSWCHLFQPVVDGLKTHDLRVMDREYKVGDTMVLEEYDFTEKRCTGRSQRVEITYITSINHVQCAFSPFVLDKRYGILSIKKLESMQTVPNDDIPF